MLMSRPASRAPALASSVILPKTASSRSCGLERLTAPRNETVSASGPGSAERKAPMASARLPIQGQRCMRTPTRRSTWRMPELVISSPSRRTTSSNTSRVKMSWPWASRATSPSSNLSLPAGVARTYEGRSNAGRRRSSSPGRATARARSADSKWQCSRLCATCFGPGHATPARMPLTASTSRGCPACNSARPPGPAPMTASAASRTTGANLSMPCLDSCPVAARDQVAVAQDRVIALPVGEQVEAVAAAEHRPVVAVLGAQYRLALGQGARLVAQGHQALAGRDGGSDSIQMRTIGAGQIHASAQESNTVRSRCGRGPPAAIQARRPQRRLRGRR